MAVPVDTTGFAASNDGSRERIARFGEIVGAGDGNRTHDIQLGKLTFYL